MNIESKAKFLDAKPPVNYYMDQLSLRELFDKYIPKTLKMQVAPADALSMMVFNIITMFLFLSTRSPNGQSTTSMESMNSHRKL